MANVMMGLGQFRFSVATAAWREFSHQAEYRWESQARLGRRPALQYLGPGDETKTLSGTIYPTYRGGLGQVGQMRAMAEQGEPMVLIDGRGAVHGKWCITSVTEKGSVPLSNGVPKRIDFELTLKRYGEDR